MNRPLVNRVILCYDNVWNFLKQIKVCSGSGGDIRGKSETVFSDDETSDAAHAAWVFPCYAAFDVSWPVLVADDPVLFGRMGLHTGFFLWTGRFCDDGCEDVSDDHGSR